jgi:hypothetical protein
MQKIMRKKQQITAMAALFSLSGEPGETDDTLAVPQNVPPPVRGEEKEDVADPMAARIGHLDYRVQAKIRRMSAIMAAYPIRPWLSCDNRRSGVAYTAEVRQQHWQVLGEFRDIFNGADHALICATFGKELRSAGTKYDIDQTAREYCPGQNESQQQGEGL